MSSTSCLMKTSAKGMSLIKHFEGFSPTIYICPAGYPTIGYGHLLTATEAQKEPFMALTLEEGESLLKKDLIRFEVGVSRLITYPINQNQFDALISFSFNLGLGALQASTLRRKINSGEVDEAADQFLRWVYAGGRKLPGLVKRRQEERKLFNENLV